MAKNHPKNPDKVFERVQTKAALLKKDAAIESAFQVTVFESNKRNIVSKPENFDEGELQKSGSQGEKPNLIFDIKKARHEVLNLSLRGFKADPEHKRAKILMAVKLGAKPPKREYRNYKEILAERKKAKEEESLNERQKNLSGAGKTATGEAVMNFKKYTKRKKSKHEDALKDYGKPTLYDEAPTEKRKKR